MQVAYVGVVPTGRRQHIGRALEPWSQPQVFCSSVFERSIRELSPTSATVGNIAVTGKVHQASCQASALDE